MRRALKAIRDRLLAPLIAQFDSHQTQVSHLTEAIALLANRLEQSDRQLADLAILTTRGVSASPPGVVAALRGLPNPAVSVIIPTFNRADALEDAVASVLRQTLDCWELVVVDDGGTDDTQHIVAPYLSDKRISYLRQPNSGGGAARNAGIAATSAPFVAYLDDDNVWYPGFLEAAIGTLATEPEVDFVYGALVSDLHNLRGINILWREFDRQQLEAGNFIDTSVMVHRRSLIKRLGGWNTLPQFDRLGDWDLALRYTRDKPARRLDALAAYYRETDDKRITRIVPADFALTEIKRRLANERVARRSS